MKDTKNQIHPVRYIFANNLRKIRRLKEISQETLAFDANLSRAYVSDVERGKRSVSIEVAGKLADALGVKIAVLFREGNLVDELTLQVGDVD